MDHYLKRGPNGIYGEQALRLILKIINEDSKIIFSNINEKELKSIGLSEAEINSLLSMIKPTHIQKVSITRVQFGEAREFSKRRSVPFGDAIHAVLARDYYAQIVSRDEKDFRKLKDIAEYKEPKDLL